MNLSTVYDKSPVFLQNLAVSAYGFIREQKRFGGDYKKHLRQVLDSEFCSGEEVREYQREKLAALFAAAKTSVHYRALIESMEKETNDPFEMLKMFPVLEKDSLRGKESDFYTNEAKHSYNLHTSGSTGTPLR